ncbi:FixH family protein [uncultured Cohaesibacter sp.]|uniref:FixH family protein n=1 Tax=uncultured Cohaesibacter sp. TaxID=1002546 RepID=UPI00292EC6AB|nr:FixH family protein [uncultured Cohaesibacter sp.]
MTNSMGTKSEKGEKKLTGRHVLYWLFGFFGVMFIANGFFVYYARSTWPGVVEDSPYEASQNYNKTLKQAAAQDARNWHLAVSFEKGGKDVLLSIDARDDKGAPLSDLTILANVGRPATEDFDHHLTLAPSSDGLYRAAIGSLSPGRWRVKIEALQQGLLQFQTNEIVTLN